MADYKQAGFACPVNRPVNIQDGTLARTQGATCGSIDPNDSWLAKLGMSRLAYVKEAWALAAEKYAVDSIIEQVGEDFYQIVQGILVGLLIALAGLATTTAVGAIVGGMLGSLAGGVGAAPGAVAGAELGWTVGTGILTWLGVAFLAVYIVEHVGALGQKLSSGTSMAWESGGQSYRIDAAARELGDAAGMFISLLLQAIVLYLTKSASQRSGAASMQKLQDSFLFKRCTGLQPWLVKNFPRLRARFTKLSWKVLFENPEKIPGTSIPKSMRIEIRGREFLIDRNEFKLGADGKPIGPVLKHMAEYAAKNASEWAKLSGNDFPISPLVAALEQAEGQLVFQAPNPAAKPAGIPGWELIIDTTGDVWKVFHAEFTSHPKW